MNQKVDLKDLDKSFSELCVISENEKTFQGVLQWNIPNHEIKKHLQNAGKAIQSKMFSIGSPSYCSFYFLFHPNQRNCANESSMDLNSLIVSIVFNRKLPESAWIKGKIHFDELDANGTFNTSGKTFEKKLEVTIPYNFTDFEKFIYKIELDVTMHCSIKISLREVVCAFDKEKVKYAESQNYDSNKVNFKQESFSDVSISIGNHLFRTHKTLLARIPYFQELFDANESEKHFELTDIEHEIFNHVLTFLYSGDIFKLSFKLACELYIVASDLKIFNLKNLCSAYLGANLTDVNVIMVLKLSHQYQDIDLKRECFKFIKKSDVEILTEKSIIL